MGGAIVTLLGIVVVSYFIDFKRVVKGPRSQRWVYYTLYTIGFVLIALYVFSPRIPSVFHLIQRNSQ